LSGGAIHVDKTAGIEPQDGTEERSRLALPDELSSNCPRGAARLGRLERLAQHAVGGAPLTAARVAAGLPATSFTVQKIEEASSTKTNIDQYSVKITKLPSNTTAQKLKLL
jgi:hypothetical protein